MAKANILYSNETFFLDLIPNKDGKKKGAEAIRVEVLPGVIEGKTTKRYRAFVEKIEVSTDAKSAMQVFANVIAKITAREQIMGDCFEKDKFLEDFKAAMADPVIAWNEREDAAELKKAHTTAEKASKEIVDKGDGMRKAVFSLSQTVADVKARLDKEQWAAWLADAPKAVAAILKTNAGQNTVNEFLRVGRYPQAWVEAQPERTSSPKAYERNFNVDKNIIAARIARMFMDQYGTEEKELSWKHDAPFSPAPLTKLIGDVLALAAKDGLGAVNHATPAPRSCAILAKEMQSYLKKATDDFKINLVALNEGKYVAATDSAGNVVANTQFNTQEKRAHELVEAVCKELNGELPSVVAEKEAKQAEKVTEETVSNAAKVFSEFSLHAAVVHLAGILRARDDFNEVMDGLDSLCEAANDKGWNDALSDYMSANLPKDEEEEMDDTEANAADAA